MTKDEALRAIAVCHDEGQDPIHEYTGQEHFVEVGGRTYYTWREFAEDYRLEAPDGDTQV